MAKNDFPKVHPAEAYPKGNAKENKDARDYTGFKYPAGGGNDIGVYKQPMENAHKADADVVSKRGNGMDANNISVRLIAGDTIVTTDEEYKPGSKLFSEIKGGGGTEITPLFDRAAEYNPASIVCFTDGWVPRWPCNTGIPTLWVGTDRTPPFGIVAK